MERDLFFTTIDRSNLVTKLNGLAQNRILPFSVLEVISVKAYATVTTKKRSSHHHEGLEEKQMIKLLVVLRALISSTSIPQVKSAEPNPKRIG